jgi:hypothetical protein
MRWTERSSSGSRMTLIAKNRTQFPHRLKKVQGKKKRDAEKAETARIEADAAGETGDEVKTKEEPSTTESAGDLLNDRDEDIIF